VDERSLEKCIWYFTYKRDFLFFQKLDEGKYLMGFLWNGANMQDIDISISFSDWTWASTTNDEVVAKTNNCFASRSWSGNQV
jgi:hypothetical protein